MLLDNVDDRDEEFDDLEALCWSVAVEGRLVRRRLCGGLLRLRNTFESLMSVGLWFKEARLSNGAIRGRLEPLIISEASSKICSLDGCIFEEGWKLDGAAVCAVSPRWVDRGETGSGEPDPRVEEWLPNKLGGAIVTATPPGEEYPLLYEYGTFEPKGSGLCEGKAPLNGASRISTWLPVLPVLAILASFSGRGLFPSESILAFTQKAIAALTRA